MTTLSIHASSASTRAETPKIIAIMHAVVAEWRAMRAARHVAQMSDEALHDIGISRGEIDVAVRRGRRGLA